MGKEKGGFLTPKAIANRIKSKGLQKLRWYCQMCQKQCRDENGFKCHTMSESHQRQLLLFADNSNKFMDEFSGDFHRGYITLLKRRFGTKRVNANSVYQEYINDRDHVHMNATRWLTLTDYVKWLGKTSICVVEETEKGWFVTYIDRDPEALRRQEEIEKKKKLDLDDRQRQQMFLEKQIERAKMSEKPRDAAPTELVREDGSLLKISLKKPKKPDEDGATTSKEAGAEAEESAEKDDESEDESGSESDGSDDTGSSGSSSSSSHSSRSSSRSSTGSSSSSDSRSRSREKSKQKRSRSRSRSSSRGRKMTKRSRSPSSSRSRSRDKRSRKRRSPSPVANKKSDDRRETSKSDRPKSPPRESRESSSSKSSSSQKPPAADVKVSSSVAKAFSIQPSTSRGTTSKASSDTKKKSALDEIMEMEEKRREKMNRKDYWLHKNIVVKINTKKIGEKYFKKKAIVTDVEDKYTGIVQVIETGAMVKLDQAFLETVLPAIGKEVLILNGAYRGEQATLDEINEKDFNAKVTISAGPLKGRVVNNVQYDDISKLAKE